MTHTSNPSTARFYAMRLAPGEDVFSSISKLASEQKLQAAYIAGCVGSLENVALRFAGRSEINHMNGKFEIVSLIGTFDSKNGHLHLSVSDENGVVIGGHLTIGCTVRTTLELVIGELEHLTFSRELCEKSGYLELLVKDR